MSDRWLAGFVAESNCIEGILRPPTDDEIAAHQDLIALTSLTIEDLERFVSLVQPDAVLRQTAGLNVRVGSHIAPPGGPDIPKRLFSIIVHAHQGRHPWNTHVDYETLHPFTDGNGRSGRALWLWQMMRSEQYQGWPQQLGFLHSFYYQTLERSRT